MNVFIIEIKEFLPFNFNAMMTKLTKSVLIMQKCSFYNIVLNSNFVCRQYL